MNPKAIVLSAWQQVHGADPSDSQLAYATAVAKLETGFGRVGQFKQWAAEGDYNWGALHANASPPCPPGTRQGKDGGVVCFKVFPSDEAAAAAFIFELTKNPHYDRQRVAAAMDGGTPEDVAEAMKAAKYFTAPTDKYAKLIRDNLASMNEPIPDGPSSSSSSGGPGVGTLLVLAALGGGVYWYATRHTNPLTALGHLIGKLPA